MNRLERNHEEGALRVARIVETLKKVYRKDPSVSNVSVPVYTIKHKKNLLLNNGKGFSSWILPEGYTIISIEKRRGPDILVFKNCKLRSVWEVTNYCKTSFMRYSRLYRYVKNLTRFKDCDRVLVVSYPDNFRKMHPDKAEAYNIEWTEKFLAKKEIFLIYMGDKDALPEEEKEVISGWVD
jgi:hypothetical protein